MITETSHVELNVTIYVLAYSNQTWRLWFQILHEIVFLDMLRLVLLFGSWFAYGILS